MALALRVVCTLNLLLLSAPVVSRAGEGATPATPAATQLEETNSQALLRAVLQLQEQLRSNQLAIEQNEKEASEAAARNAESLLKGLQKIDNAFTAQQEVFSARGARELEAMQASNRVMLIVAGTFAAISFLAMLIGACFQWRMRKAWDQVSTMLSRMRGLGAGSAVSALANRDQPPVPSGRVQDSNLRLLGAMEQLEKRIQNLEQSSTSAPKLAAPAFSSADDGGSPLAPGSDPAGSSSDQPSGNGDSQIQALLRQGQAKLKENDLEAALTCFDGVLSINPNHSGALVKKGTTLERLKKLSEAFECYDRAIAADDSLTIAYLHKGGLCNRLERFKEALECYEQALRTQDEQYG